MLDSINDSIRQELLATCFGLPGCVIFFGIIILIASRETIPLVVGILFIAIGSVYICISLPSYYTTMRSIDKFMEELKERLIQSAQEDMEPYAKKAINTCVVM